MSKKVKPTEAVVAAPVATDVTAIRYYTLKRKSQIISQLLRVTVDSNGSGKVECVAEDVHAIILGKLQKHLMELS